MTIAHSPPPPPTASIGSALRRADWLTGARARLFARLWLALGVVVAAIWVLLAKDNIDRFGRPIGGDFAGFWTAAKMAMFGHGPQVYDPLALHAAQSRLFGRDVGDQLFVYPPIFLWICLPLASLPYLAALGAWLGATGFAYGRAVRAWLGTTPPMDGWLAILAFPAVLLNAGQGENGFLSAAMFGGGALLLERRPVLAGALLGALVYNPHLGLIVPLALLIAGRWRSLFGVALAMAILCGLSLVAFGLGTWRAFLAGVHGARGVLEQGLAGEAPLQSVFAAVRFAHGSLNLAYACQAGVAAAVVAALAWGHLKRFRAGAEGPAMVTAALLASPFLHDYDLILLAIPLAWLLAEGLKSVFMPWEKIVLAAAFLLPAAARGLGLVSGFPIAPFVVAAVFALVLRRWLALAPSDRVGVSNRG